MAILFWNLSCSFSRLLESCPKKLVTVEHGRFTQASIRMQSDLQEHRLWCDIKKQLKAIREFCEGVSSVITTIVTLIAAELLFYYAVALDEFFMLGSKDWLKIITNIFWFVNTSSILYFTADGYFQVQHFKIFLSISSYISKPHSSQILHSQK